MADTTVKIFNSSQSSAPTLPGAAGQLIAVLDACLVNGWGALTATSAVIASGVCTLTFSSAHPHQVDGVALVSGITTTAATSLNAEQKITTISTYTISFATSLADQTLAGTIVAKVAPAGWTKAYSGTNIAVYKSASSSATGMYLRVDDTTTTYASIRCYETMTDASTGTNAWPTTTQQAAATWVWWKSSSTTVAANWWVIANASFFYIGIAANTSYPSGYYINGFGDYVSRKSGDAYRCFISAMTSTSIASGGSGYQPIGCVNTTSYCNRYTTRSYASLGSAVAVTGTFLEAYASSYVSGAGSMTYPNPEDNGILFNPSVILQGTTFRGELPGLYVTPQNIANSISDDTHITNTATFGRTVVYKTFATGTASYGGVFIDVTGPWGN